MKKEDLEKLLVYELSKEKMESIYINIETNLNKFIKNQFIKYKKEINIRYRNPWSTNYKYQYNAYADKIIGIPNTYEIYICSLLIKDLYTFAHYTSTLDIFRINKNDNRQLFADSLFYFWLYFISLHEYSHIILGHTDYKRSSKKILEFIDLSCLSEDQLIESQAMELEADSTAAILTFASILSIKKEINKGLKKLTDKDLIYNHLLGLYFLFDFFNPISKEKRKKASHPLGIERAMFFNGSINLKVDELRKELNISKDDFLLESGLSLISYLRYLGMTDNEIVLNSNLFLKKLDIFDNKKILDRYKNLRLIDLDNGVITNIKQIFHENPENAISAIKTFTSKNKNINKCWINIGGEKFGKLTLDQILNNEKYSICSKTYTMDIFPLDVIGSYQKPFTHTSLINILNGKDRYKFCEFFDSTKANYDTNYFFKEFEIDKPIYISFNDINGVKRYIVSTGNHRTLIGSFLQMIDNSFKLRGVICREYTIDWSKFSPSRIVFWKTNFDMNSFLKRIEI
ncbi:hypothetical protein CKA55_07250 [Arcobacter suis]|uniref:Uncharacterized protein n=1 Tax=Arcobacter suis CECT 7833 TaxID=663365 RepID=A0AAD0WQ31_9BACT|nr:hypothetical protein [Arcobacter suis]AXX89294.1 hypothetical protein ASUIS_0801 [Arcobacter suis CECT 7833]RWS46527.1 hypothetical protein CKA55_07250 [Arcobacter suis]